MKLNIKSPGKVVSGGKEFLTTCPNCGKPYHFYIHTSGPKAGLGNCKVCNFSTSKSETQKLFNTSASYTRDFVVNKSISSGELIPYNKWNEAALSYWSLRGLNAYDAKKWNPKFCSGGDMNNRIVVNSFDKEVPNLLIARTITNNLPRYLFNQDKSKCLFGIDIAETRSWIVIMEGTLDVICSRIPNAVAILGSSLSAFQKRRLLLLSKGYLLWLDTDAKVRSIGLSLAREGAEVLVVNQLEGKDPAHINGDLSKVKFMEINEWIMTKK